MAVTAELDRPANDEPQSRRSRSTSASSISTTNTATAASTAAPSWRRPPSVTVGGLAMAQALLPRYAQAQTISFTDPRIKARYVTYPSPGGSSGTDARLPGAARAATGRSRPSW